jgi:hypothetical protein
MAKDRQSFDVHVVGDGDLPVDWSAISDIAAYVSAALAKGALTVNRTINVPSVRLSQNGVVDALRRHGGKPVNVVNISTETAQHWAKAPHLAPAGLEDNTRMPVDFGFLLMSILGQGAGIYPRAEMHHALFPEVTPTTFDEFLAQHFAT